MPQDTRFDEPVAASRGVGDGADGNGAGAGESAADALRTAWARIAELPAFARYFLAAKIDRLKLTIRQYVMLAALGVLALLAAASAVITAIVLVLQGIAGGLTVLCGHGAWIGDLLCGIIVLGAVGISIRILVTRVTKLSRESTVLKYESDDLKESLSSDDGATPQADAGVH